MSAPADTGRTDGLPDYLLRLLDAAVDLPLRHRMPKATATARRSAVLILFGEGTDGPDVLLIEKSPHLRSHAGQPAFPGGGVDPGDDFPVGTALREAEEEAGVDPAGVRVLVVPRVEDGPDGIGRLRYAQLQPGDLVDVHRARRQEDHRQVAALAELA